ncbi:MAG: methyltransferase domain-containing protein [Planctomycetota bacterium]
MDRWRGYRVREEILRAGGLELRLLVPADPDGLLDDPSVQRRFEQDEYMPYWAKLWPGALLLAEIVGEWPAAPGRGPGILVLELGCGVGLVGLVAASRGYRVTLSDYDEDALAFAAENARRNRIAIDGVRLIDWRREYPDLRAERIVAADVLYEARNLEPVARFVARHLVPGGLALVADANRTTADAFEAVARAAALAVTVQLGEGRRAGEGARVQGRVFHLRHTAGGGGGS